MDRKKEEPMNVKPVLSRRRVLGLVASVLVSSGVLWPPTAVAQDAAPASSSVKVEEDSDSKAGATSNSHVTTYHPGEMVKVGNDAVVNADEKLTELVVVFGDARVEGEVGGEVVVVFGNADVNGRVGGDCVTVFGKLKLGPKAQLGGETIVAGGSLERDPGARLASPPKEVSFEKWAPKLNPLWKWIKRGLLLCRPLPPTSGLAWFFVGLFFLIYLIIAALMPRSMTQCVQVLDRNALAAFGLGLVALVLFGPLVLILIASGVGLLIVPFVALALVAAVLVGKAASFQFIGLQLMRRLNAAAEPQPLAAFLAGAALVTVLYMVPILGFVLWGVLVSLGLGAALMAAFRAFRRNGNNGGHGAVLAPYGPPAAVPGLSAEMPIPAVAAGLTGDAGPGGTATAAGPAPEPSGVAGSGTLSALELASLPRAGFWLRFAATLLDLILLGWVLSKTDGAGVLLWIAYHVGMWTWKGTTIGGVVCRIKVVRENGQKLEFSLALVRALAAVFSLLAFGLGFFWAGWSRERQSWHDKIAGTIIVKVPHGVPMV